MRNTPSTFAKAAMSSSDTSVSTAMKACARGLPSLPAQLRLAILMFRLPNKVPTDQLHLGHFHSVRQEYDF